MLSLGLRTNAVTCSESPSRVDLMDALPESTILIELPHAHAMKEPSDETAKGPPV